MGWFSRKPAEPELEWTVTDHATVPEPPEYVEPVKVPQPGERFEGNLIFSEGWYYPILTGPEGVEYGPDRTLPIVWVDTPGDGHFEYAHPTDPNHFHRYGLQEVDMMREQ